MFPDFEPVRTIQSGTTSLPPLSARARPPQQIRAELKAIDQGLELQGHLGRRIEAPEATSEGRLGHREEAPRNRKALEAGCEQGGQGCGQGRPPFELEGVEGLPCEALVTEGRANPVQSRGNGTGTQR